MRSSFIAVLLLPFMVTALSWGAYDLGLYGISPTHKFVSTSFLSPWVKILQWDPRCDGDGAVVLISPRGLAVTDPGPVMLDARGDMIWTEKRFGQITNLQVQHFDGQDYLTFWAGVSKGPHSNGTYYLVDSSYEIAYTVSAVGPGRGGDLHEFKITKNGTALFTIYEDVEIDCSDLGIGTCWVDDCIFQEVDIKTGNLVFEWRASDHVRLGDSFKPRGKDGESKATAYDFFHINSVDKDGQGNYLISARHMHTVYYISPSGDIIWSLGGRNNDFTDLSAGKATDFSWQHHANWQPNNTMTLFNNGGNNVFHSRAEFSRGMRLSLDIPNMTVTLLQTYVHPDRILAISQGSIQVVPDSDNVFIGWGNSPTYTEFSSTGEVLCSIRFGASLFFEILDLGWVKSYRGFKGRWIGRPKTLPDIDIKDRYAFVSWNGATEVKTWKLQSAESRSTNDEDFQDVQDLPRTGFETSFALDAVVDPCVRIAALDAAGKVLGYTKVINKPAVRSVWLQVTIFAFCFIAVGALLRRYQALLSKYFSRALAYVQRKKKGQMYELISSHE